MLTLFKTSELMEDIWVDYIQKRAAVYKETADQMDRYPFLANLDYIGKAHDYSYDFLAMQAVRCQRTEVIRSFLKNFLKQVICILLLLNGFWLVPHTGHAEEAQVFFDPGSYVGQMLTLFKTSELMEDIWIDYIQKRAAVYKETADQMDRYPCLLYTSPSPRDTMSSRMPSSA